MPTVELRFAALPGHVRTARLIAAAVSRRSGVPEDILDEVKLAVGEACARAVSMNRRFDPQASVVVRIGDDDDVFEISVSDCGSGSDGTSPVHHGGYLPAPEPVSADRARISNDPTGDPINRDMSSGGPVGSPVIPAELGLALIKGLADDVAVTARPDAVGTVVTMRWLISKKADAPLLMI
jgi:anti-sigma regulatory factor (Ser/Thr protein kinase)